MIIRNVDLLILMFVFSFLQGNMAISVTHGGDPIPKSPFHITVAPPLDIGKVKVDGLDNSKFQMSNIYVYCLRPGKEFKCFMMVI